MKTNTNQTSNQKNSMYSNTNSSGNSNNTNKDRQFYNNYKYEVADESDFNNIKKPQLILRLFC